ncbi:spore coat protein GerQ [Paenibacillus antarcticus]
MMSMQPFQPVSYQIGNERGGFGGQMNPGMGGSYMMPPQVASGNPMTPQGSVIPTNAPVYEQSYVENILRLNRGKTGTFYMTYENNKEWNAKIFKGIVEAAGRDHIIISEPSGKRVILLTIYLDYITFDEPINYQYPGTQGNQIQPRR